VIVVCDRRAHTVEAAVSQCRDLGVRTLGCVVDVTDRPGTDAMVARVRDTFGRIDVLVNNAAITKDARLQTVADLMVPQGSGAILNASSVVGLSGTYGQTNDTASKFGVIGFTKTWSRELGPKGVRANAVAPGFIETPILASVPDKVLQAPREQVPLKRLGRAEEIANVYAFLASDEASYVNGAVIEVSGGMTV